MLCLSLFAARSDAFLMRLLFVICCAAQQCCMFFDALKAVPQMPPFIALERSAGNLLLFLLKDNILVEDAL